MGHDGKSSSLRSTECKPKYQRKGEQTGKLNWRQMDNGEKSRAQKHRCDRTETARDRLLQ
jgi:hypothetical protein